MKQRWMTGLLLMALATSATAAVGNFNANVLRVISDNKWYGGCMASLSVAPSSIGLDCAGQSVTFSCTGDFATKDQAKRNFELAQMAMLLDAPIQVVVDDTKKHNGYCLVKRVDMVNPQ